MATMASDLFRRCGCRDEAGKSYRALPDRPTEADKARACPTLVEDPKHGSWGYYVDARSNPNPGGGKQYRRMGFPTRNAARKARTDLAAQLDKGTFIPDDKQTVGMFVEDWLPRHLRNNNIKPTTANNYRRYVRMDIAPSHLGTTRLSALKAQHVEAFIDDLVNAGRGTVTIRRIVAVLKTALKYAVKTGRLSGNPAADVDLPGTVESHIEVWDVAELQRFLKASEDHRLGALFRFVVLTGLRRGEVTGLRWDDVDFVESCIWIRNTRVQVGGKVVDQSSAKTAKSAARVELDTAAVDVLMAWKIAQDAERAEWDDLWEDTGFVFTMDDGNPLQPAYVTRLFSKLQEAAGVPKMTFHGLRHEHAALMAKAGVDVMVISKRLRHSNIGVTNDFYGHLLPNVSRDAASKVSAMLGGEAQNVTNPFTQEGVEGKKKALAGTADGSDKGFQVSPLPDSNRRPSVYKTDALAS
ncbi:tyrosine-type recombinase/integrase [Zhihengliuella somnathii]